MVRKRWRRQVTVALQSALVFRETSVTVLVRPDPTGISKNGRQIRCASGHRRARRDVIATFAGSALQGRFIVPDLLGHRQPVQLHCAEPAIGFNAQRNQQ